MLALLLLSSLSLGGDAFSAFLPRRPFAPPSSASTALHGTDEYGASSTSFYTTTEKQESYDSLDTVMAAACANPKKAQVIRECLEACADITEALRTALVTVEGSSNTFGDAQLSVDVIADELLWDMCKNSKVIMAGASEEDPEIRTFHPDQDYTACWDPLDGSSIVDNNWAVGTMIGVWDKSTGFIGATGRDQ
ncbi:hypothetical protein TeGR_g9279, partial [Tetraparma gracilis]